MTFLNSSRRAPENAEVNVISGGWDRPASAEKRDIKAK